MAKRRKKQPSYDIRPPGTKTRKRWNELSSSGKSSWRAKLDTRPGNIRRYDPLDRMPTQMDRAEYTKFKYRTPFQKRFYSRFKHRETPIEDISDIEQARLTRKAEREYTTWSNSGRGTNAFGGGLWGYDIDEFKNLNHAVLSHGVEYRYTVTYFVVAFRYKGGQSQVILVNGPLYMDVDEVLANVESDKPLSLAHTNVDGVVVGTRIRVLSSSGNGYGDADHPVAARYPERAS